MNTKKAILAVSAGLFVVSCAQLQGSKSESAPAAASPAPAAASPAPAPAPAASKLYEPGLPAPKLMKSRDGTFDGELYGAIPANSKFSKLQFGMGQKEVMDTAGQPTDQKTYVTGKAWIPFYFGGDRWRHEMFYKGEGRLIFAGGSGFGQVGYLLKIVVDPKETGYAR